MLVKGQTSIKIFASLKKIPQKNRNSPKKCQIHKISENPENFKNLFVTLTRIVAIALKSSRETSNFSKCCKHKNVANVIKKRKIRLFYLTK